MSERGQFGRRGRITRWFGVAVVIVTLVSLAAVQDTGADGDTATTSDPLPYDAFDIDKFEQGLRSRIDGKTIGYAYAVYQNGTLKRAGGSGRAVIPTSPMMPTTYMSADRRGDLLSMSKTITAAALLRTLEILRDRGEDVTISSPIAPYLPHDWVRGPGVEDITFRAVLRHEAGLMPWTGGQDLYQGVKWSIAYGVDPEFKLFLRPSYCGCNYALMRVLIPHMLQRPAPGTLLLPTPEDWTGQAFVDFVRQQLFLPAGFDAGVEPSGPTPYLRYYSFWDPTQWTQYAEYAPRHRVAGAGFFYLSVKEFASFLDRLRRGLVISPGSWELMRTHLLGIWPVSNSTTAAHGGDYLCHNGGAGDGRAGSGFVMFPNGVTVVTFHNSGGSLGYLKPPLLNLVGIQIDAFHDAYPKPTIVPASQN